jgi:hypothetical protein
MPFTKAGYRNMTEPEIFLWSRLKKLLERGR